MSEKVKGKIYGDQLLNLSKQVSQILHTFNCQQYYERKFTQIGKNTFKVKLLACSQNGANRMINILKTTFPDATFFFGALRFPKEPALAYKPIESLHIFLNEYINKDI